MDDAAIDDPAEPVEPPPPPPRRPSMIPLGIMALVLVAGLLMLWRGSFRRTLSDKELESDLAASATDYETAHAAEEMSRRIQRNPSEAKSFYPALVALSGSENPEKRRLMAWVMGGDPQDAGFKDALTRLVEDPVTIVAYNAAPALAKHGSPAGRKVLLAMLKPSSVIAKVTGAFHPKAKVGDALNPASTVGTITTPGGQATVEASLAGTVETILADGSPVSPGAVVATLSPAQAHALNALVALMLPGIGQPEDADAIEAYLKAYPGVEDNVKDQARQAVLRLRKSK
jgi:biotin carboxyl carrier protein